MDNYCTKCGNKLEPGQKVCARCGNRVNGTVLNDFADKIKAYDYKGKAEELKVKANETVDKVKSYDYKAASENIKNSKLNSLWKKRKNILICIICLIIIICILSRCGSEKTKNNQFDTTGDERIENSIIENNHFKMTKDEFVEAYNKAYSELSNNNSLNSELLSDTNCTVEKSDSNEIPNTTKVYVYDQTYYASEKPDGGRIYKNLKLYTDKNNNCVAVAVVCTNNLTTPAKTFQVNVVCRAAYIALTNDYDDDNYISSTKSVQNGNGYEYALSSDEKFVIFSISPGNLLSNMLSK